MHNLFRHPGGHALPGQSATAHTLEQFIVHAPTDLTHACMRALWGNVTTRTHHCTPRVSVSWRRSRETSAGSIESGG